MFGIEPASDSLRAHATCVEFENSADYASLFRVDHTMRAHKLTGRIVHGFRAIPIGSTSRAESPPDLPKHSTASLFPQILNERLVLPAHNRGQEFSGPICKIGPRGRESKL